MKTKNFVGALAALIFVISGYAQIKLPTRTLVGISFDEATPTERLSEYIRDMKVYDIFLNVPDTLHSLDMRNARFISQNISKDWDLPIPMQEDCLIGLEVESKNAVFLFPNLAFAWPKSALRAAYCINDELKRSVKDFDLDVSEKVKVLNNNDKSKYCGADTIMIYNLDFEVPFMDKYQHCIGVYLRTYAHNAMALKIALTDEGFANAEKYIQTLFDIVNIGSNPDPEYIKAEKETESTKDWF